jgi:6-pyruvoyltetrahydropterin/6-carboxytetrahydropterin synthase
MFRIGKTFKFDAAHQLEGLPETHQCSRLHGHTYKVTVELRASQTFPPGWLVDYAELLPFKDHIDGSLDHRFLNEVCDFNTTAENLAAHLYDVACMVLDLPSGVYVDCIRVQETESTYATYSR